MTKKTISNRSMNKMLKLCLEWQKRLRLMDWTITAEILNDKQMEKYAEANGFDTSVLGVCKPYLLRKEAYLVLREEKSDSYLNSYTDNFESTLVHELMHIHFAAVPEDFLIIEEQTVESLTKTLIELKYGKRKI